MKNHRFLWLRNRTTDNRKCEKARNIKEKRTIEMFNTDSRRREERASSPSVNFREVLQKPPETLFPGAFSFAFFFSDVGAVVKLLFL